MGTVLRFRIQLLDIEPPIWRRLEVPETYTFWDLHVAIQDVMGWQDRHVHAFLVTGARKGRLRLGVPDPYGMMEIAPGWKCKLSRHFRKPGDSQEYEYDFGDYWRHSVTLEAISLAEPKAHYPRCLEGERHCPPEDCGGVPGYGEFLEAIGDAQHPRHAAMLEWCGGAFDAAAFDAAAVVFRDPRRRLKELQP